MNVEDNDVRAVPPAGKRLARVKPKLELDCVVARRNTRTSSVSESMDNDALIVDALAKITERKEREREQCNFTQSIQSKLGYWQAMLQIVPRLVVAMAEKPLEL